MRYGIAIDFNRYRRRLTVERKDAVFNVVRMIRYIYRRYFYFEIMRVRFDVYCMRMISDCMRMGCYCMRMVTGRTFGIIFDSCRSTFVNEYRMSVSGTQCYRGIWIKICFEANCGKHFMSMVTACT